MEHAVDFGGFRACFGESTSYGFQHTMSEPTRERITHLRANGLLLDHHGIPPSGADNVSDEEWQALCDMALRSLSSPSATGAISKEMIWKIACIETNQTTIGGKPVVGTDAAEKIATMLAAAPAPAEPVDVLVLQESIKALDEVNTAWFNELEEIKKIVGYVPAECKQTLTRYIKGIVEKATSPVVEAAPAEPVAMDSIPEYFAKPGITEGLAAAHPAMLVRQMANEILRLRAAPTSPVVEAGATGWIAAHESGRIHHFSIADGWTVEVVTK